MNVPGKMWRTCRILAAAVLPVIGLAGMGVSATHADGNGSLTYIANPPNAFAFSNAKPGALPPPSVCEKTYGFACYTPSEIKSAYNIPSNLTGKGQTIVIVDAYGSPTVQQDLHTFDQEFGLSDPTLNIFYPMGQPTFNPQQNHAEMSWANETSLDTQWAHAIAPDATIDLVIAPNNGGNALNNAVQFAVQNHLGNVLSMSYGSPEAAISGGGNNLQLQQAHANFQAAQAAGISVFASAGDYGASNYGECGACTTPNAGYPASDPLVTSVGGTNLFMSDKGAYQSETTWNDADDCPFGCTSGPFGATGGAPSAIFSAPSFQSGSARTVADVGYNASVYTAVMVYLSVPGEQSGFYFFGGTSEGAPQWAAITALADQNAGHALGYLNPQLYAIASNKHEYSNDFHDVTVGDNAFLSPGFNAGKGYDMPTGLGSPNVANLIGDL